MTILQIATMLLVFHLCMYWASYLKFQNNGIGLNAKYKLLLFILPYLLLIMHIKIAARYFRTDKKKALRVVLITFTKYPILLGNLIELIQESMAECDVFGDSKLLRVKKVSKKESIKQPKLSRFPLLNFEEILAYFRQGKSYENVLIAGML